MKKKEPWENQFVLIYLFDFCCFCSNSKIWRINMNNMTDQSNQSCWHISTFSYSRQSTGLSCPCRLFRTVRCEKICSKLFSNNWQNKKIVPKTKSFRKEKEIVKKNQTNFCDDANDKDSLTSRTVVNSMPNDGVDWVDIVDRNRIRKNQMNIKMEKETKFVDWWLVRRSYALDFITLDVDNNQFFDDRCRSFN